MYTLRRLMPILNALLVFDEAGRQNSFTHAGRNLGMAQPSVSRFVANLENHLGSALFERQHNRLRLTACGERLHRAVAVQDVHRRRVVHPAVVVVGDERLVAAHRLVLVAMSLLFP